MTTWVWNYMKIRHSFPTSPGVSKPVLEKERGRKVSMVHTESKSQARADFILNEDLGRHYARKSGIVSAKNPYQEPDVYLTRPPGGPNKRYTGKQGGPGDPESADKPPNGTKERDIIDQRVSLIMSHFPRPLNARTPIILPSKIFDYTLCSNHVSGGPKAKLFEKMGYVIRPTGVDWKEDFHFRESGKLLSIDLKSGLMKANVVSFYDTMRGVKFVAIMEFETPNATKVTVETAWVFKVKTNKTIDLRPSLTSARIYTIKQEEQYLREKKA